MCVRPKWASDNIPTTDATCLGPLQVFLVRERHSGKIYAMKVLNKSNIIKRNQVCRRLVWTTSIETTLVN